MRHARGKLAVALLAVPESAGSALYGMYEILRTPDFGPDAGERRLPFEPFVVSCSGEGFSTRSGLAVQPQHSLRTLPAPDIVVVPDILVAPEEDLAGRFGAEGEWLRAAYALGSVCAATGTGTLVLAETGMLNGQYVTAHWAYCDALARRHPRLRVLRNRTLLTTGPGQRLVMAGGGSSWQDLALFLVARFAGGEAAMRVARQHLIDCPSTGGSAVAAQARATPGRDAAIEKCQQWIAMHYDAPSPVAAMVRISGLSERSFKRRFLQATGMSPLEYVHALRLEETKQMLESTDLSIEAIANLVGYEDGSFFGRLFRRKAGLTPAQYRRRFCALQKLPGGDRPPPHPAPGRREPADRPGQEYRPPGFG